MARKPSATGLGLLAVCPFRYYQTREADPRVDDAGPEALRGRIFHDAAKRYCAILKEAGQTAAPDLAEIALADASKRAIVPFALRQEIETLWGRHVERFELDLDAYVSHEELQDDPDFRWVPDLLYAREFGIDIWDFKTFYFGLSEAQARQDFQALFYAWRASVLWPGFSEYRFTFDFVRLGKRVPVTFTANELGRFADYVAELVAARDAGLALVAAGEAIEDAFEPRPGEACAFCALACPVADDARVSPVRLQTAEDAVRVAGETLALDAAAKARKEALKAYCGVNGAVQVNGMEWAVRGSETVSYQALAVVAYMLDRLIDPAKTYTADEVSTLVLDAVPDVSISKTALTKVLRKHPALAAAGQPSTRYEFRSRKAGVAEEVEA